MVIVIIAHIIFSITTHIFIVLENITRTTPKSVRGLAEPKSKFFDEFALAHSALDSLGRSLFPEYTYYTKMLYVF